LAENRGFIIEGLTGKAWPVRDGMLDRYFSASVARPDDLFGHDARTLAGGFPTMSCRRRERLP
jgi:hypothetical protein